MTITTADDLNVTYVNEGGYDKLKISDSSSVTILDKIKMIITHATFIQIIIFIKNPCQIHSF
jgi:hypothetical protein